MRMIHALRLRLRSLCLGATADRELDEELRYHLDRQIEEHVARGLTPDRARREALLAMGGVEQRKEECRDMRMTRLVEDLIRDVAYNVRTMRRNPGFTAVVILSLALGIGANTAIFSAIDTVMLRLLPVRDPAQLVMLTMPGKEFPRAFVSSTEGPGGRVFSFAAYEEIRDHNDVFASTFAFVGNTPGVNVGLPGRAEFAGVKGVSGNFFEGLGVPALHGRMLRPDDDREAAPAVAVVSHRFWTAKFGQDPSIVGRPVVMNGAPVTIVGVAPAGFFGLEPDGAAAFWIPIALHARQRVALGNADHDTPLTRAPRTWWLMIVGRMKPGVTARDAQARVSPLFERSLRASGGADAQTARVPRLDTLPMDRGLDRLRSQVSSPLLLLMGMVGLVLLIACANVAALLLARASARQREIAIRLSLGAGPLRLIRQFLTESVLMAVLGGAAGLLCAVWIHAMLVALLMDPLSPMPMALHLDGRVLAFTAAVSVVTGLLFGLAPAVRATRVEITPNRLRPASAGRVLALASRKILVGGQVAACLLLLMCAGLLLRTLQKLEAVDLGFDRQHLVLFTVSPGMNGYRNARLVGYYDELRRRLATIPSVRAVTLSLRPAVGGGSGSSGATIPGVTKPGERPNLFLHQVGPMYFETLGIPIVRGRSIGPQDTGAAPHVAVISQTLAQQFFRDTSPIGRQIDLGSTGKPNAFEIVGMVQDAKYDKLRADTPPVMYVPYQQFLGLPNVMTFAVRADADLQGLVAAIEREARASDPNVPVINIRTQREAVARTLVLERMLAALSAFFGVLALALACVGLYGTMAYAVARRTREIGVRMALGAGGGVIQRMILRETLVIVASGLAMGVPAALAVTRLLQAQLFGLTPHDPLTMILAVLAVLAATILAGYLPARRASKVNAMVALRCD